MENQKASSTFKGLSQVTVKLDRNNFPLWESLTLPTIRGNKLEGFITGGKENPKQFLTDGEGKKTSPEYEDWIANDQILLHWLFSSMTIDVASQLIHCKTSKDLWTTVTELSALNTRSRITLLKDEFQRTREGAMKMEEYLSKMKSTADNLTLAIMLTFENRLEQLNSFNSLSIGQSSANMAQKSDFKENSHGGWRAQRGSRGGRFRGRGGRSQGKPTCQLCKRSGHVALNCFYRFNRNYNGPENPFNQDPSAFVATPDTIKDASWYIDGGASHHVTNDVDQMHAYTDFNGQGDKEGAAQRGPQ